MFFAVLSYRPVKFLPSFQTKTLTKYFEKSRDICDGFIDNSFFSTIPNPHVFSDGVYRADVSIRAQKHMLSLRLLLVHFLD